MRYIIFFILGVLIAKGEQWYKRIVRDFKQKHTYICPEEDCWFEIYGENYDMVNNAVVQHWDEHPYGGK